MVTSWIYENQLSYDFLFQFRQELRQKGKVGSRRPQNWGTCMDCLFFGHAIQFRLNDFLIGRDEQFVCFGVKYTRCILIGAMLGKSVHSCPDKVSSDSGKFMIITMTLYGLTLQVQVSVLFLENTCMIWDIDPVWQTPMFGWDLQWKVVALSTTNMCWHMSMTT